MLKALAIKELRESMGLVIVAGLLMVWAIAGEMSVPGIVSTSSTDETNIAFINDSFYAECAFLVGALAAVLGLKQSAWELHLNTYYYLLHRPIARRKVLTIKLVVGMSLVFGLLALAILIYGSWAATPGHRAAPFEWSMTGDTWLLAGSLPLVYLGGFLSGIHPGRWYGSRLFPLVAAMLWVTFAIGLTVFWWLQLPLLAIGYAGWLLAIDYYAATRDY